MIRQVRTMMAVGMALIACLGASAALGQTPTITSNFDCADAGIDFILSSFNFGINAAAGQGFGKGSGSTPELTYTASFRLPLDKNYQRLETAADMGKSLGNCQLIVGVTSKSPGDGPLGARESYRWTFTEVFIPKLTVVGSDGASASSGSAAVAPSAYVTATFSFAKYTFVADTASTANTVTSENESKKKKK
jgi:hypothetical protein